MCPIGVLGKVKSLAQELWLLIEEALTQQQAGLPGPAPSLLTVCLWATHTPFRNLPQLI